MSGVCSLEIAYNMMRNNQFFFVLTNFIGIDEAALALYCFASGFAVGYAIGLGLVYEVWKHLFR